ncbi:MAG: hypothetical protein HYX93_02075 [Chloroflexi bacterium]|nr:hypothetical protein [Chloroflexota bacterium]
MDALLYPSDCHMPLGIVSKHKEQGRTDPDLEWARQDPRVRELLGMASEVHGAEGDPLTDAWNNDADARYDGL